MAETSLPDMVPVAGADDQIGGVAAWPRPSAQGDDSSMTTNIDRARPGTDRCACETAATDSVISGAGDGLAAELDLAAERIEALEQEVVELNSQLDLACQERDHFEHTASEDGDDRVAALEHEVAELRAGLDLADQDRDSYELVLDLIASLAGDDPAEIARTWRHQRAQRCRR